MRVPRFGAWDTRSGGCSRFPPTWKMRATKPETADPSSALGIAGRRERKRKLPATKIRKSEQQ